MSEFWESRAERQAKEELARRGQERLLADLSLGTKLGMATFTACERASMRIVHTGQQRVIAAATSEEKL